MTQLNTISVKQYDIVYKVLHWIMAALVLLMFMGSVGFASAVTEADKLTMLTGHSSMGIIVSCLLFLRILKRFVKNDPRPVHDLS